ncbi:MAG: hypothetical protein AUJ23_00165 [Candidatus Magasanikbacteria bacterium CG1_02_32_51]|uniref:Dipeptidylpeptidase IV N-terminal domain-containing protein n=1 Tax=Candidatus Magasanikbacteria bacterium CG1_02_32_51 TaxID=1805238 RepID=A0A1J4U9G6_9BACT|nr:MAG: hypothetical protein AUJ23_00165 [Candidatus Magasanikbacteria bacterium CG1_02_32_51]
MDKKRIIYITIFIIVCILLGYAIYFVFFKKASTKNIPSQNTTTSTNNSAFPNANNGQNTSGNVNNTNNVNNTLTTNNKNISNTANTNPNSRFDTTQEKPLVNKITDIQTLSVAPATSGNGLRFYNTQDGKFYQISASGVVTPLSDQVFFNVSSVTWSPKNNESIIEYPDGANTYYNFSTKQQITLPTHWQDFSFSIDGSQIAAKSLGLDPSNRWLITSDPQGKNINLIEPMGDNFNKVIVDWSPNRQVVALSATGDPLGSEQQQILPIGLNQENYKGLVVEGRGLEIAWSKDGSKLLHSAYNGASDYKPALWVVDATPDTMGNNRKQLGLNTWASKCTMADNRFVYCGVPTTMETGVGFTPELSDFISDDIYKIDIQTGIKTIIPTDDYHTIESMYVSADGTTLYFTDTNSSGIFDIPIK